MAELITSPQNPRIKNIVKLQEKSSERRAQDLIVIEGKREIGLALAAGITIDTLFYCRELCGDTGHPEALQVFEISRDAFDKVAYRENSDGLLALARPKYLSLNDLQVSSNPFYIVLESVEKPGNLGAILRTADAAKADALMICDPRTDIYNPNAIRSSVGCVFTVPLIICTTEELQAWFREKRVTSYAAALTATSLYHETDLTKSCAIVMGTEATGLSHQWLNGADEQIKIPMRGMIDSMNVSAATAVLAFEAMRQRGF